VGSTSILPLSGPIGSADFTIVGRPPVTGKEKPTAQYRMVDSSYFRTMGIPTRAGRTILDTDTADGPPVLVISQSVASLYWKTGNPVGSRVLMEDNTGVPRELEVVGIVGDTREMTLEEAPTPCVYVAMPQIPQALVRFLTNNMFWVMRTENHVDTREAVKRAIRQLDSDVAVVPGSMDQYLARVTAARRFALQILVVFAAAALLLAAGGLYALVSFTTAQRTREFGVRIALGARRADIAGLVVRQGLLLAAIGVACGTAATYGVSRLMGSLLYAVSPHDPLAVGGAAALLLLAAVAACGSPVRRALRADPVECLRSE
jgi:putative ABC transport system permease protein